MGKIVEIIVNLENFQGPLDLLLHLIEKRKLNIAEVKITQLIDEYLEIIDKIKKDNLYIKVDFVLITSELLEIKALELIKSEQRIEKEKDLKRRLEEYKMLKELTTEISKLQKEYNISYSKVEGKKIIKKQSKEYLLKDLKQMDLFAHYKKYIENYEEDYLQLNLEKNFNIEEENEKLLIFLAEKERSFCEIFHRSTTKSHLIHVFLLILELYKDGLIAIDDNYVKLRSNQNV